MNVPWLLGVTEVGPPRPPRVTFSNKGAARGVITPIHTSEKDEADSSRLAITH